MVARQQRKGDCYRSDVAHIYGNEAVFFSCYYNMAGSVSLPVQ